MSQVSFKGNVGKVRGLQFAQGDGKPRFSFSVAEGHWKSDGKGGFEDTGCTWWNVTVFGRDAETLADVIQEGQKQCVSIAGRASTREYEVDGTKRSSLDVVADIVGIIPSAQKPAQTQNAPAQDPWGAPGSNQPTNSAPPF